MISTLLLVNLGDQAVPSREPLSPGRPVQVVQCSGSRAGPVGTPWSAIGPGVAPLATTAATSASDSSPRSAPQYAIAGSRPAEQSMITETASVRRWIRQSTRSGTALLGSISYSVTSVT